MKSASNKIKNLNINLNTSFDKYNLSSHKKETNSNENIFNIKQKFKNKNISKNRNFFLTDNTKNNDNLNKNRIFPKLFNNNQPYINNILPLNETQKTQTNNKKMILRRKKITCKNPTVCHFEGEYKSSIKSINKFKKEDLLKEKYKSASLFFRKKLTNQFNQLEKNCEMLNKKVKLIPKKAKQYGKELGKHIEKIFNTNFRLFVRKVNSGMISDDIKRDILRPEEFENEAKYKEETLRKLRGLNVRVLEEEKLMHKICPKYAYEKNCYLKRIFVLNRKYECLEVANKLGIRSEFFDIKKNRFDNFNEKLDKMDALFKINNNLELKLNNKYKESIKK